MEEIRLRTLIRKIDFSSKWTILLCVLFEMGSAKGPPEIRSNSPLRHSLRAGESLRLNCPVHSMPPAIVSWQKDDETIHVGWDRYRINEESHQLRIKDLEQTDSGIFVCQATNGFGNAQLKYLVYVYEANITVLPPENFDEDFLDTLPGREEAPQFLNKDQMDPMVAHQTGDIIRLSCKSSGIPKPEVTWYKNGAVLRTPDVSKEANERWTMSIMNSRVVDSGKYMCKVVNKAGSINFTYNVHVTERVPATDDAGAILRPPRNMTAIIGTEAMFECHIRSDSVPHVQWLKRLESSEEVQRKRLNSSTTVLLAGQTYAVLADGVMSSPRDGTFVNRLTIAPVGSHDTGMYICSTTTAEGFSYRTAFLSVMPSGLNGASDDDDDDQRRTGSVFDVAFLPVIIGIVAVVGVSFFAVVAFVVCRRRICADKSSDCRSSPDSVAAAASAAGCNAFGSVNPPTQRLTSPSSAMIIQGGMPPGAAGGIGHPYQHPAVDTRYDQQFAAMRSNPSGGCYTSHVAAQNLMGANSRERIAKCHPDSYTDYSSIVKAPTVANTKQQQQQHLLLQQQQQQRQQQLYQREQLTTQSTPQQLTQLHFYENC